MTKKDLPSRVRPKARRTMRTLGGGRLVIEGFGRRSPAFIVVAGAAGPFGAWLSPRELRRFVEIARKILK